MISHLRIATTNNAQQIAFYEAALAPLGYTKTVARPTAAKFTDQEDGDFVWVVDPREAVIPAPGHLAFAAPNHQAVDDFYTAAMAQGGTDNGKPGLRTNYGPNYYAAFVYDHDGNNIEAVCNKPSE